MKKIEARVLKGFRDFSPQKQKLRLECLQILQEVFDRSGYLPIDTPILEYEEILLGKSGGETEKQIYRFQDNGGRDVVMRFDLTVPFARYVAMNKHELPMPFFRSQIGKVFRGENTQKGRYREFIQCDFDIIGIDNVVLDFTILQTILDSFEALQLPQIKVHISHRGMFNEFLAQRFDQKKVDLSQEELLTETLRIVDKLRKIGEEKTRLLLCELWDDATSNEIVSFGVRAENNDSTLEILSEILEGESKQNSEALSRLKDIYMIATRLGISERIVIDPSITRGLDYYTGFVCETFVEGFEDMGSVCSGGRYNDLTQMFNDAVSPGVGASIGLDRLLSILEEARGEISEQSEGAVCIMSLEEDVLARNYCLKLLSRIKDKGFSAHLYPLAGESKMKQFFKYTEKVGSEFLCIIGTEEIKAEKITVKRQKDRTQIREATFDEAIIWMKESLK